MEIIRKPVDFTLTAIEDLDQMQQRERVATHPLVRAMRAQVRKGLNRIMAQMPLVTEKEDPALREVRLMCEDGLELLRQYETRLIKSSRLQQLHACLQIVTLLDEKPVEWTAGSQRFAS